MPTEPARNIVASLRTSAPPVFRTRFEAASKAAAPTDADPVAHYHSAAARIQTSSATEIDLSDQSHLQDIPPLISSCRFLLSLNLSGTAVSALDALSSLPRLERLALWGTPVRDLEPLRQIKTLRWLNLGSTDIVAIDALMDLPRLEVLDLSHTNIENIEPLETSLRLRELILRGTRIVSIAPLARLRDLMLLDLAGTGVTDTSPIKPLRNLVWLNAGSL